jgi:3',5'-cyclic AMP phosphodiesterase CpdA
MIRILHLSDPHFGTTSQEKLDALRESVKSLQPDLILFSGDITQRARVSEFKSARKFLDQFPDIPKISTTGNHDISLTNMIERFFYPYRRYTTIMEFPKEGRWRKGDVEVICLNSTSRFRHKDGALNTIELLRLDPRTEGVRFRLAVFHHPMDCRRESDEKNIIKGAASIASKLQSTDVDLVVGGHVHDPFVTLSSRKYPGRPFVISVAGTCLSSRTRSGAPNSFSVYEIEGDALKAHRFDLGENHAFKKVASCQFTRHSGAWSTVELNDAFSV